MPSHRNKDIRGRRGKQFTTVSFATSTDHYYSARISYV